LIFDVRFCFFLFGGFNDKSDTPTNLEERRLVEQLWQELKPLHELVHAYVRQQIYKLYPGHIELDQPIPVHLTSKVHRVDTLFNRISFRISRRFIWFNDDIS